MRKIEDLPQETQFVVKRLIDEGCIEEHNGEVDMTDEMAKLLVILDRADAL